MLAAIGGEQTGNESEDHKDPSSSTHMSSVLLPRAKSERDYPNRYRHEKIVTGADLCTASNTAVLAPQ